MRSITASGPGVCEDRLGHVELADVVHERAPEDLPDLRFGEPGEAGDPHREGGDPAGVGERVRAPAFELGDDEGGLDLAVVVEGPRRERAHGCPSGYSR